MAMRALVEAPPAAPTPALAVAVAAGDPNRNGAARHAAHAAYRDSRQTGRPLTGAELAQRFGMSERWGRNRIAEVKAADGNHGRTARPRRNEPDGTAANGTANTGTSRNGNGTPPVPATTNTGTSGTGGVPDRSWVDLTIILVVAAVAAVASYGHMLHVALVAGEPLLIARAFPITVDGLVLAALRCGERGRHWLKLGIAVSVAANVLAQFPDVAADIGPVISAWPPVALYGTHRLVKSRRTEHTATEVVD